MKALRESSYSSTLSFTSVLDRDGWLTPHPDVLTPVKNPVTDCTGGWVGPRAGLDGCRKYSPHRDLIPVPFNPWRVAIVTALPRVPPSQCIMLNKPQGNTNLIKFNVGSFRVRQQTVICRTCSSHPTRENILLTSFVVKDNALTRWVTYVLM
jgi:hypothetical protein